MPRLCGTIFQHLPSSIGERCIAADRAASASCVQRLRAIDLRAVVAFGHDLAGIADFGGLPAALAELTRLTGADSATLTHLDLATRREVAVFWPPERAERSRLAAYAPQGHAHPLRPALAAQIRARPEERAAVRVSDLLSQRQWRAHPLRAAALPDLDDQMSVLLDGRDQVVHAVTLGRLSGAFTARQRDLLQAAGRFLAAPVARAPRAGHRALQIAPHPRWVPASEAPGWVRGGASRLPLSGRELEVLGLVAEGATDQQIARRLGISAATVSKHLSRIYARLGVPNRAAAVRRLTDLTGAPGEG